MSFWFQIPNLQKKREVKNTDRCVGGGYVAVNVCGGGCDWKWGGDIMVCGWRWSMGGGSFDCHQNQVIGEIKLKIAAV